MPVSLTLGRITAPGPNGRFQLGFRRIFSGARSSAAITTSRQSASEARKSSGAQGSSVNPSGSWLSKLKGGISRPSILTQQSPFGQSGSTSTSAALPSSTKTSLATSGIMGGKELREAAYKSSLDTLAASTSQQATTSTSQAQGTGASEGTAEPEPVSFAQALQAFREKTPEGRAIVFAENSNVLRDTLRSHTAATSTAQESSSGSATAPESSSSSATTPTKPQTVVFLGKKSVYLTKF